MITARSAIVSIVLGLLVLWLPLPYGSATPGGVLAARLSVILAGALTALLLRHGTRAPREVKIGIASVFGLTLLGIGQLLPLPAGLVKFLSPGHLELGSGLGGERGWIQLTIAPTATMSAALTFLCVGVALWSAARSFSRVRRRWLAVAITGAAIVQVFLGLRGWLSEEAPRLHGTFVNPDHLAVYLEIALCVCFAMCTWAFRWAKREPSLELRVLVVATPIAAWFVIFSGLLLTGSRAGLLAALCGLAAQCFLLPSILKYRGGLIVAVLPATAGLVALGFMGLQKGLGRWLMTSRAEAGWTQRTEVWSSSLDLIGDFPLTGSGLGSFAQAFPLVQAAELVGGRWTHAHNDPLELLTTGGAVAGVLLLVGLVALVRALWRVVRDGNRTEDRVAGMAAIGALVSVGLHELVDFGLTLPANGLTLALLVGASAAARLSHQKGEA